jgi:hypothetical protein
VAARRGSEQTADFGNGERQQAGTDVQAAAPLSGLAAGGQGTGDAQERVGEQSQGDVPIPAGPAAHLVVIQADLPLGAA